MDYSDMLDFHKQRNCDVTIAVLELANLEEASRFGIMNTDPDDKVYEFEEKPAQPKSNLASMGIYIFTWEVLKQMLIKDHTEHPDSDFGKHIIPAMLEANMTLYAYRFKDYWKDVGTVESYFAANMELIRTVPDFNLYDDFWKIYTDAEHQPPQYIGGQAEVRTSLLSEGCEVYGSVVNSVLGPEVIIEEGAVIRDSIIMAGSVVKRDCNINHCIIDEDTTIGEGVLIGQGENVPNTKKPKIYDTGITVIGERTVVPAHVSIGKNCVISGKTALEQYPDNRLESGGTIIVEEEVFL
jgi:glucose-1-phosphate adenylyltransferase